jgi:DMSO/TMAO reductase YedYZ molybdopterin-dependent catalytic subunit
MGSGTSFLVMNTTSKLAVGLVLVLIAAIALIMVFGTGGRTAGTASGAGTGPAQLAAVGVREFEGKKLSSVSDFRENSIRGPQQVNITDYRLTITGLTNRTVVSTYDEVLSQHPHYTKVVTLFCVEGWDVTILWEGVLVRDLLYDAGIDPRANTVIFTAHDGYTTSFPLAYLTGKDIIMAYRMNNITLPAEQGYPFALVAEDKWGYKWIKWIEKIELSDNPDYRGYWEQRGYSNTGDLDKNFFTR